MKQQQLWQILLVTGSVWLGVAIGAKASASSQLGGTEPISGSGRDSPAAPNLPRVSQSERPLGSAQMLVKPPASTIVPTSEVVPVTVVKAHPTDK